MEQSESIAKLATALSKAQGEIGAALKDSKNPHFNSTYADLAACVAVAREPLASNGLAVVQTADDSAGDDEHLTLVTTLVHSSGEWMRGRLRMPAGGPGNKLNPQTFGSCMTYNRRYSYCAILGIVQEDDDGNGGSAPRPQKPAPKQRKAKATVKEPAPAEEGESRADIIADLKHQRDFQIAVTDDMIKDWCLIKFGHKAKSTDELKQVRDALNAGEIKEEKRG